MNITELIGSVMNAEIDTLYVWLSLYTAEFAVISWKLSGEILMQNTVILMTIIAHK